MENPFGSIQREAVRRAGLVDTSAARVTAAGRPEAIQAAGGTDSGGGWRGYGLLGLTRLGEGLRVRQTG
ncbi:MAG: hypothetical protein ACK47B_22530 [Armatimonadota bacterium]